MHQGQAPLIPAGLDELRQLLETEWPARVTALHAARVPLNLYDDLTDDQLRARAQELGVEIADDADRAAIAAAVAAKEKPPARPPWNEGEFDPDRAWKLLQDTRADKEKLKAERDQLRAKVQEHEDATKTEQEKAAERAAAAEREAQTARTEAARLRVALKKNLTEAQARRLVGETEEELEADADELLATFQPEDAGGDPLRRPKERLRPGAVPSSTDTEETDPAKLAAMVPRRY